MLIIGGSLGALAINELVPNALALIPEEQRPTVWHQAGEKHLESAQQHYQAANVTGRVTAFIDDMAKAYAWADLIICRAGALTVSEVAAAGCVAIFVPFPYAVDDHQTANAKFLTEHNAGILIQQRDLTPEKLAQQLTQLFTQPEKLQLMAAQALQRAPHHAAEIIANFCCQYIAMPTTHFIGIGGIGMSAIAEVMLRQGQKVSGSDQKGNAQTAQLQRLGMRFYPGHAASNVQAAERVVVSTAIRADNPELLAAQHKNVVHRADMLAALMQQKRGIAVTGTHGKTTTTSLLAEVFTTSGVDPSFINGGVLQRFQSNARLGAGPDFIVEADESDASFLKLQPEIAIVTNLDVDHMETYQDSLDTLQIQTLEFLQRLPNTGLAVLCGDDARLANIAEQLSCQVITYGFTDAANVQATEVKQQGLQTSFTLQQNGQQRKVTLNMPGAHNVLNALAAIIVAEYCGIESEAIDKALMQFAGVERRQQCQHDVEVTGKRITLVNDYGHHPVEINATLQALKAAWPDKRIVVAFQPHKYSRTRDLFNDFIAALTPIEHLIIVDTYPAGETLIEGADGKALCDAINANSHARFVPNVRALYDALPEVLQDGDVLVLQGAGDIGERA